MRRLQNLSIRSKFLLIVTPLLLGILYLVGLKANDSYQLSSNLTEVEKSVALSVEISYFVHEIQKERGNSSGYLSNQGTRFGEQLAAQRQLTDKQIAQFRTAISSEELAELTAKHSSLLNELNTLLDEIPEIRQQVDDLNYTPNQAIDTYTIINTFALNALGQLIPETRRSDIALQTQAYINFLKSKERAGIERAIGSQAFSIGEMNAEVYKRFSTLVAAQDSYLDAFLNTATAEGTQHFYQTMTGEAIDEVDRMRQILYSNEALSEDPIYWFSTITKKIELLKNVEDYLTREVVEKSEVLANLADRDLILFSSITVLLIALDLWVMFSILFGLIGNISILSSFTRKVASGDLSGRVEVKSTDELGQFAGTLNNTVGAIQEAQKDLKTEKDKAQYMYETIYKTSEVVFANVDQGVFLVGEDMKISQLHSQALEHIFEKQELAGRNFLDLMSPMLVPRDREALKVFSKHLFNPRVKNKVLGRLNPVEEVQIFSGSRDSEGMSAKHIKVSFSRVSTGNKIENVMVTVLDVTQEIQLQKKIKQNEEKSRQETEQLLSIIKINPVALREYLDKSMEALNEIYQRYESEKTKDFESLVKYTFNIIHNLKGNATLIELDLLEDKFHAVEESLVKLRGTQIQGSDFLKILYEINEIKGLITDMGGMIRRIANIYYNSTSEEEIFSNEKLIHSFERAVKRLNAETGKKAQFSFENPDDIVLPEKLKIHVNDMVLQLVRNSMAHGIESPVERKSLGKEEVGNITVTISETLSGALRIKYEDDGRGLDQERILAKASSMGLIDEKTKSGQGMRQAYNVIFEDGFTTATEASVHAGRGQGMNVVKSILEKVHGTYELNSYDGEGFEMLLSLPVNSPLSIQNLSV